jgi:LuxR family transcriptional regulator, maltose regulon positive regulatory protein
MADQLLRTKLMLPPGHVDLVARERLHRHLDRGVRGPLTLVVAPAGSGKSSLFRSWRGTSMGGAMPLAWVALDEDDNDPVRFWRYALAGLETLQPELVSAAQDELNSSRAVSFESVLALVINSFAQLQDDTLLVLDDYHLITSPRIHESLTFLIERLPPCLHLCLVSRVDPPLPLARWRARGQLTEIRTEDLRFSEEETGQLMTSFLHQALTSEQIEALTRRTEGWAAGLHLTALALRGREQIDAFIETFSGSHQFIAAYLIEDVLEQQPTEIQSFLLQTSVLSQLKSSLCNAVTGRDDGQAMLERLTQANLFVTKLDESGTWLRYHQLFVDVLLHLQMRADSSVIPELHRRAAEWYDEAGLIVPAVDHVLRAESPDKAGRLIGKAADELLRRGEAQLVLRWLDLMPDDTIRGDSRLALVAAWSRLIAGPIDAVEPWLLAVEADTESEPVRGEVAALRTLVASFLGDTGKAIAEADAARRLLPAIQLDRRSVVAMSLGQAYRFAGELPASADAYREAIDLGQQAGNLHVVIDSYSDLGLVLTQQGRVDEADALFREAERFIQRRGLETTPAAGALAVIWPETLRERNELDRALAMVERGIELGHLGAKMDILITGYRCLGRVLWGYRRWDEADAALERSWSFADGYGLVHTARGIAALRAQLALVRGELRPAFAWADRDSGMGSDHLPAVVREAEAMTRARVLVAQGRPEEALDLLDELLPKAERNGRTSSVVSGLIVQALAHQKAGDQATALASIGRALKLARSAGYVRLLLDEGEPVQTLLRGALAAGIEPSYVRSLLAEGHHAGDVVSSEKTGPLIEPLSEREGAVLRLLMTGMSAPEIAAELYVSPSTVRTHLKSLYRKLDVHSRDQAIQRAKELNLI